jgi:AcrR family transcriptional regulator
MTAVPKHYHHGNLRAVLLEHAERMLATSGADGLSLRELAREAGVSHGAPRRHFPDKQALLDALAETGFERLGRELNGSMEALQGTFVERLVVFARAYVGFATRHPALLSLMHASKGRSGAESLRRANDQAFAAPIKLISDAQSRGDIVDDDPDRVAMAVLAVLQGLAVLVISGMSGNRPIDPLISGTIETLVLGLRPRSGPVREPGPGLESRSGDLSGSG